MECLVLLSELGRTGTERGRQWLAVWSLEKWPRVDMSYKARYDPA